MIFQTERLKVRKAEISDTDFYLSLWNSGDVMRNVGFPDGLQILRERVLKQIKSHDETEFNQTLVVLEKQRGRRIGECKLGQPDCKGVSSPDLKFLPEFWGKGYGKEMFEALCLYILRILLLKLLKLPRMLRIYHLKRWLNLLEGER